MNDTLIVDASAMVDLLLGTQLGSAVAAEIRGTELHAPAHFDAEVLSALGRLQRAGSLTADQVAARVDALVSAPVHRHLLPPLLRGAYGRRENLRLVDALYVELADQIGATIVTTDAGLAAATPLARLASE